jgi:hypothetical protein
MRYIRDAALVVTAFAFGTALTSLIALREHDWTRLEGISLACSTVLLVAWLACTLVASRTGTIRVRYLAVSLALNLLLGSFVVYFALGVRQDDFWLWSRSEAALSLLSPRLLRPSPIEIRPYSAKYVEGYSVEACSVNRLHPNFIGDRDLGSHLGIEEVAVETVHRKTVVKILMRSDLYNKLAEYCRNHREGIAYVVNGDRVLLEDWEIGKAEAVTEPNVLITHTGEGLSRLEAERFLLWFKRNPKLRIPRT